MTEQSILMFKDVLAVLHASKTTFYRSIITDPTFPQPFKIGLKRVAWRRTDIETWVNDRATAAQIAA